MSYRGRPSKGCEGCRARKVKCDEAKPACSRCTRSHFECKYRDQDTLLFRNQTAAAAQRAEDSWRKRSKSQQKARLDSNVTEESIMSGERGSSAKVDLQFVNSNQHSGPTNADPSNDAARVTLADDLAPISGIQSLAINTSLIPDLCSIAYDRFVYDFVTPDNYGRPLGEPTDSLYAFVPLLYERTASKSCLATVVQAVSYINYANRFNAPEAAKRAEECLGRGITMLSKIIGDKDLAASDEVLCSSYLLGVYENISSIPFRGTFVAHQHGANALLQLRTIEQYCSNPISARLYEVAYTQMLLANLQAGKRPHIPVENILNMSIHLPDLYNKSNTFVIELIWREAQLHSLWHETKQSNDPPSSREQLQDLLQTALDLDIEYQSWEAMLTPNWGYRMEPNTSGTRPAYDIKWQKLVLESKGAPEAIHLHPSLKKSWIWGFYRTSRMFLLRDTLELLNWMFRLPEPNDSSKYARIRFGRGFTASDSDVHNVNTSLDTESLGFQHTLTTVQLVNTIEKACSAILGNFIVPIPGKSFDDVMVMRGYVCLWPLGTMDSILSSGLIPNTSALCTQPEPGHYTTKVQPWTPNTPETTQSPPSSSCHDSSTAPIENVSYAQQPDETRAEESPMTPESVKTSSAPPPVFDPAAKKGHVFDSSPMHPYDCSADMATSVSDSTNLRYIDVGARREWINSMLYYIGSELGIKKALAVPYVEGFLPIVKPRVDEILGR
ncbi:hypothetical protein CC86DRAFT_278075 [Ophiobolus disseminans]|uniref:Zn(2)-C6 fungal-type domain-containing protein n=1 Tax=Ophiobolus disseminans TaxID=1469910 RepID=A0A6A7AMB2_9PLEO|nr:hypothetical protein CC86DRAFT_278075 [Ophiobolus disseminans]